MPLEQVFEFFHTRKGRIVGVRIAEIGEWVDIRLVGEQQLRYASISNRLAGPHPDGDVVRVRKTFLTGQRPLDRTGDPR